MERIKASSKRGNYLIQQYNNSKLYSINDCYCNPSRNKRLAEKECIRQMYESGGKHYKILSYNTMMFTCGWITAENNLRVETAHSSYLITDEVG